MIMKDHMLLSENQKKYTNDLCFTFVCVNMGGIDATFFLDISFTFILQGLNWCSCNDNDGENDIRKMYRAVRKMYIAGFARINLGFFFNIGLFAAICIVNNDTYRATNAANGLFITIVVYTCTLYILGFCFSCFVLSSSQKESSRQVISYLSHGEEIVKEHRENVRFGVVCYKFLEIIFDIFCLMYELTIEDFQVNTDFNIAVTSIAVLDISADLIEIVLICCCDFSG